MTAKEPIKQNKTADLNAQVPELITGKELAKRLHCTARTIDNWTNAGIIKRIKCGRLSRYNWLKVVESLEAQND